MPRDNPILYAAHAPDPATAAQRYRGLGFSVLPLRGKIPRVRWAIYQRHRPTSNEVRRWTHRGLFENVGIVCGAVSGNLVVLDFDAPGVYTVFRVRFPQLAQTYTVATGGGGWHVYLRVDALPPSLRGQGVELRADGQQIVAPPSTHPDTGQSYRVSQPLPIRQVADLGSVIRWIRSTQHTHRPVKEGTGHGAQPDLVAALTEHFQRLGYCRNGDWLNGSCIYPERHAHRDAKRSFGFNTKTGYGFCFVCGSMLASTIGSKLRVSC